jgi:hypothetical protein
LQPADSGCQNTVPVPLIILRIMGAAVNHKAKNLKKGKNRLAKKSTH